LRLRCTAARFGTMTDGFQLQQTVVVQLWSWILAFAKTTHSMWQARALRIALDKISNSVIRRHSFATTVHDAGGDD
jgi:hypothetical protein